ncbi:MAG: hypothetical protein QXW10_01685 [Candidatus Micrarchaeaceae archaeon]
MEIFKSKKHESANPTPAVKEEAVSELQSYLNVLASVGRVANKEGVDAGNINLNFGIIENIIKKYEEKGKRPEAELLKEMLRVSEAMLKTLEDKNFVESNKEFLAKSDVVEHAKQITSAIERYLAQ